MTERTAPKISKWPFFLGDLLLLGAAGAMLEICRRPFGMWETAGLVLCVALAALFGIWPFLRDHDAALKFAEADSLSETVAKIDQLDTVARQITTATSHWQSALDQSQKTVATADNIAQRMAAQEKEFIEFMQKANETEKATLRLEVDKLRRTEGEWLQVLVRMLDHTYALYQASVNSGQPQLVQQLGNFQFAVRDAARRVGLAPFIPAPGEPFDAQLHQLEDEKAEVPAGANIAAAIATGYTYQGQLIRPALVSLQIPPAAKPPAAQQPEGQLL